MRRKSSSRKGGSKIVSGLLLLGLLAGAGYIYTAPEFERVTPEVHSSDSMFWNRKDPLKIKLTDNTGLENFELILSDGQKSLIVGQGSFEKSTKEQTLLVKYPQSKTLDPKAKQYVELL